MRRTRHPEPQDTGDTMRIRTVKPEFFTHYGLYALEKRTGLPIRVAYEGLWGYSDRAGRFEWKPGPIKLAVFPFDECEPHDVLRALAEDLYVVQYIVNGRAYGWIPTFSQHQAINARESASRLPPPPPNVVQWYQNAALAQNMGQPFDVPNPLSAPLVVRAPHTNGAAIDGATVESLSQRTNGAHAVSPSQIRELQSGSRVADASSTGEPRVDDGSGTRADATSLPVLTQREFLQSQGLETLGSEIGSADPSDPAGLVVYGAGGGRSQSLPAIRGKRDVEAVTRRLAATLDEVVSGRRDPVGREQWRRLAAELVFAYWAKLFGKDKAFLSATDPRERRILQRLAENDDDVSELLYALDGGKSSRYHMGDNDTHTVYDGLETLLRDRAQVEKLSAKVPACRRGELHAMVRKYGQVLGAVGAPAALQSAIERDARANGTSHEADTRHTHDEEPAAHDGH